MAKRRDPNEPRIELIFDTTQMRPACVLLQAAFGVPSSNVTLAGFDPQTWLTAPTDGMKRLAATKGEWEKVAARTNKRLVSATPTV